MCLAVPGKVLSVDEGMAEIELSGLRMKVSTALVPKASVNSWVIVHAGYAISVLDEEEALTTLEMIGEVLG